MLSFQTVNPDTLELLKTLMSQPEMQEMRLVGGTSLAIQYGHRQSIDLDFFGKLQVSQNEILDMISRLGYDLKVLNQTVPKMFINTSWDTIKKTIVKAVNDYQK